MRPQAANETIPTSNADLGLGHDLAVWELRTTKKPHEAGSY